MCEYSEQKNTGNVLNANEWNTDTVLSLFKTLTVSVFSVLAEASFRYETRVKYEEGDSSRGFLSEEPCEKGGEVGLSQDWAVCGATGQCAAGEVQGPLVSWKPQQRAGVQVCVFCNAAELL